MKQKSSDVRSRWSRQPARGFKPRQARFATGADAQACAWGAQAAAFATRVAELRCIRQPNIERAGLSLIIDRERPRTRTSDEPRNLEASVQKGGRRVAIALPNRSPRQYPSPIRLNEYRNLSRRQDFQEQQVAFGNADNETVAREPCGQMGPDPFFASQPAFSWRPPVLRFISGVLREDEIEPLAMRDREKNGAPRNPTGLMAVDRLAAEVKSRRKHAIRVSNPRGSAIRQSRASASVIS